jgi:cysteinyl-tRNA synthetase
LPPSEMFKPPHVPEGKYSAWNDQGLPTRDGEGKELSKNATKTVAKEHAAQAKLHDEFLKWQAEEEVGKA